MPTDYSGQEVQGYRIVELLGEGGTASVWRAVSVDTGTPVAIKIMDPELARDPEKLDRFFNEARIQINLVHPSIARVHSLNQTPPALVEELVDGRPLSKVIGVDVGPMPLPRALMMMNSIMDAVAYAHDQGVVHRDIKPSNILVTPHDQIKVMDFGTAKDLGADSRTRTGIAMGTPAYMAPEQIMEAKAVDGRADIYSLGITFYEMLAGRTPFEQDKSTDSDFIVMSAHVNEPSPDPREFIPDLPSWTVPLLLRALEKQPEDRFQTVGQMQQAWQQAATGAGLQVVRVAAETVFEIPAVEPPKVATSGQPSVRTVAETVIEAQVVEAPEEAASSQPSGRVAAETMFEAPAATPEERPAGHLSRRVAAETMFEPQAVEPPRELSPAQRSGRAAAETTNEPQVDDEAVTASSIPRSNTSLILGIVLGGLLLISGAVAAVVFLSNKDSSRSSAVPTHASDDDEDDEVDDKASGAGPPGASAGGATGAKNDHKIKAQVPKAMVKQSRPQIDGTMNASTTYRTLRSGMRCVRGRYQRALKRDPGLTGKVSVCLIINTQGRVTNIDATQDTVGDSVLTRQIKACLKRLRFSPPEGGSAEVCVPFLLQSKKALTMNNGEARAPGTTFLAAMRWVSIPGGTFMMGSASGKEVERPVHRAVLRPFQLMKSEVSVRQYRACVKAGGCSAPLAHDPSSDWKQYCNWTRSVAGKHPVNCVSWIQAAEFCKWAGGRLPTEAEWEYAARSGGKPWIYPWGDEPATCSRAVMGHARKCSASDPCWCGRNGTWQVCSKTKGNTTHGLCDMAGNVWEWVEDCWHPDYNGAPSDGSAWVADCSGSYRVRRGGGGINIAGGLKATHRSRRGGKWIDLGFRCAR